jgi:hypothetical protein
MSVPGVPGRALLSPRDQVPHIETGEDEAERERRIVVEPAAEGWVVRCLALSIVAVFRSGARAEAAARRLGQAFARTGASALVVVHDRRFDVIGTARYFGD